MEFYVFDNITEGKFKSTGIGIDAMVKVCKSVEKAKYAKTVNEIEPYNIVYLENGNFAENTNVLFKGNNKKEHFALIKNGETFEINYENVPYFARLANGRLNIATTMEKLEAYCTNQVLTQYSEIEKKAYDWLENGRTGLSSLTICATLLPNLSHDKLEKVKEEDYGTSYPYDTGDFQRCLGLLNHVPELKSQLIKMKAVTKEWSNLVDKWSEIENSINNDNLKEANDIIRQCINRPKMKNN